MSHVEQTRANRPSSLVVVRAALRNRIQLDGLEQVVEGAEIAVNWQVAKPVEREK